MRQVSGSPWLGLLGVIAILVSKPLWLVATYAWSESIFALAVFASLVALERFTNEGRQRVLYLAAIFAGLALLTRHAGVFLVFSGFLYLLFTENSQGRSRWKSAFLYGAISLVPGVLAWTRVVLASGNWSGDRASSTDLSLSEIGQRLLSTIANWIMPWSINFVPQGDRDWKSRPGCHYRFAFCPR